MMALPIIRLSSLIKFPVAKAIRRDGRQHVVTHTTAGVLLDKSWSIHCCLDASLMHTSVTRSLRDFGIRTGEGDVTKRNTNVAFFCYFYC